MKLFEIVVTHRKKNIGYEDHMNYDPNNNRNLNPYILSPDSTKIVYQSDVSTPGFINLYSVNKNV